MRDAVIAEKLPECYKFNTIIRKEVSNLGGEVSFHQRLKHHERPLDLRFELQRIEPGIASVMTNKYKIIFVLINGENWRCPDIGINVFKRVF